MKVTVVPAQVTTVEDRIAGNLGMSQLMLLAAPIFGGSALYIILPPSLHSATYKLVAVGILAVLSCLLAIRVRGKIVLLWLIVLLRYNLRPRYYIFDKHSLHGREQFEPVYVQPEPELKQRTARLRKRLSLSTAEIAKLQAVMENPAAKLSFETKKGGLYVRITEIKEQS